MSRNRITLLASSFAVILAAFIAYFGGPLSPLPASAATITVDAAADADPPTEDDGDCTLREAIDNANDDAQTHADCESGAGDDTIVFDGVALVTLAADLPHITDPDGLMIDGDDAVTISGDGQYQPFFVDTDAELTLDAITVTMGLTTGAGGAIANQGTLTVLDSQIVNSNAFAGGGIINQGTMTLTGTNVSGNSALNTRGGAIYNFGTAVLTDSTVSGNTAAGSGGGIFNSTVGVNRSVASVFVVAGSLTLNGTTVSNNTAFDGDGGGIWNDGDVLIDDSTVGAGNDADFGGGIYINDGEVVLIDGSEVNGNTAETGAGIYNQSQLEITGGSLVTNNEATSNGGGIITLLGTIVTVSGSSVTNNTASGFGGGINTGGDVEISNSSISGNEATNQRGGGIYIANGTVTVTDSLVDENNANSSGGGGIFALAGTLTLDRTTVSTNSAQFGGGLFGEVNSTLEVTNGSQINGNTASINGGGVITSTSLTVTDSSVTGNTTGNYGGGINSSGDLTLTNSTVTGNTATTQGGGGIQHQGHILTITNSTIAGNTAGTNGGGLRHVSGATGVVTGSTVGDNTAGEDGGGIFLDDVATITVINSAVVANNAGFGGGIRGNFSDTDIANSTLSGNTAMYGAGIYNGEDNTTTLTNVTVTANSGTTDGGGLYNPGDAPGDFVLTNTIVADQLVGEDCGGTGAFVSQGNNLDSDNTCNLNASGDIPNGNANLGPLAVNGGPTQTHALIAGSDAIDTGGNGTCAAAPVDGIDQRGVVRPQGDSCDIGAFEFQAATPTPSPTQSGGPTPTATPSPTGGATATPTPTPTGGAQTDAIWADDDCNNAVAATDALKKLQDIASIDYNVEPGCPTLGDIVGVQPAGFGQRIWGDTDCDGDYDAVDALQILRSIAGLPVNQTQPCPLVGEEVLID